MKAVKSFMVTLAIVISIGVLFLVGKSVLSNTGLLTTKISTDSSSGKKKTKAKANPITKAVVSETLESLIEQEGGTTKAMFDSMSEEDKDTVVEIIASNVSLSSIPELTSYATSEDSNALLNYANDNFPEDDISELEEILEKYQTTP